jgi:hypothetical protein
VSSLGNISYANCCGVELAINKVLWVIMPLLLLQVLSKKISKHLCFLLPFVFFFFTPFGEERVVCIVYPVGSEYSKKVHRRKPSSTVLLGFFLDDCRAAGIILLLLHVCSRTRTIAAVIPDFFFHAPCDLKERRGAWWSLLLQEQDREDICSRCDFRLCSMLPVIWRKGESCSIVVVPRTGSGRYLQVWFPTLFNFPCDLKERRDLVHRCSKNRSWKIFAGAISEFVKCSLWSEGK